jgi:hypothetical protein
MTARAVAPDLTEVPISMEQVAPGRWTGSFPSEAAGSYLIVVNAGSGGPLIRTGINVGSSPEYHDRETNLALLDSVAQLSARGGHPGAMYRQGLDPQAIREPNAINPFRRDLQPVTSTQPVWPWFVVVGSCLFWCDVFVRRVQFPDGWLGSIADKVRRLVGASSAPIAATVTMERLRHRKQSIREQMTETATSARFNRAASQQAAVPVINPAASVEPPPEEAIGRPEEPAGSESTNSPTERLLKAKRDLWRRRDS